MFSLLPGPWERGEPRRRGRAGRPAAPRRPEPADPGALTHRQFCSFYALLVRSRLARDALPALPANSRPQPEPGCPLGEYLERIYSRSGATRECCLGSLVLMRRFDARCLARGVAPYNAYRLSLVSLMVAHKLEADRQLPLSAWDALSGSFYGERALALMEQQFLRVLDYDVFFGPEDLRELLSQPSVRDAARAVAWGSPEPEAERAELSEGSSPRAPRGSPVPLTARA